MAIAFPEFSEFSDFARPDGIYLLNHSVGIPPHSIRQHLADGFIPEWLSDPAEAWTRWVAELDGFHAELARLLNHDPKWFCHQVGVSSGATKIIHALPFTDRRPVILLSERSFPSLGYVAQAARNAGYQTRMLPRDVDSTDPEVWRRAMTDDVAIVVITHAESNRGTQLPVADIVDGARQAGVVSLVDVAQSAGVLPIDLRAWQADFVMGTSVKWLGGGPGSGFLWASPEVIDRCEPVDVGWFSHEEPFEFDIHDFRFAPDARRFLGGTPSPIPAAIACRSIKALNEIGLEAVRHHNVELTQRLIDGLDEALLVSPREVHRRSGTVVIDPGETRHDAIMTRLAAADVHVDSRAEGIRLSPHLVNNTADIDRVLELVVSP